MIQEFAQWIENISAGWTVPLVIGSNLFVGHRPQKTQAGTVLPERYTLILENTPAAVVPELRDRQDKEIQFLNYAKTYFTARADAYSVYERIHGIAWITLPVLTSGELYLVMTLDAVATPAPIEIPDAKGLFVFSTNYILRVEDPNCVHP